ncbi:hypothetical protein PENCOP_c001G04332 [Penicillium coprophilum]|uniref:Protein kinase domain-containing protein n=1 Tax=Penicillium coprophilum TaxID=36646 RepID=A0A1V6V6J0_9EURO|nr:hypothetical protein PENCOP_c001G04332 [Penicillium coprophilum]
MGDKLDYRLDLWYTGCFIYQLLMYEPPFPGSSDDFEHIMNIVGSVDDLPVEWEPKVEDLQLISKQNRVLEKVCHTDKETYELEATEATLPESIAPTEEKLAAEGSLAKEDTSSEGQHTGTSSQQGELAKLTLAPRLQEVIVSCGFDAPEGKQELPVSDASPHLKLTAIQEDHEQARLGALEGALSLSKNHEQQQQPVQVEVIKSLEERGPQPQGLPGIPQSPGQIQPEASADTPEPVVVYEPPQAQELGGCQRTEKAKLKTKTGTLDPPSDHHDRQLISPESSKNIEHDQLELVDGASNLIPSQGEQQPELLDVCQSADNPQSETQTRTATSDLLSDYDGPHSTSSEVPRNLEPDQLEIVDGASDLLDNQGGHQPEISDIPESSNQPQREQAEDSAASSDDGGEQKPRSQKRLRSRIGGLLNHCWTPWKKRRKS